MLYDEVFACAHKLMYEECAAIPPTRPHTHTHTRTDACKNARKHTKTRICTHTRTRTLTPVSYTHLTLPTKVNV